MAEGELYLTYTKGFCLSNMSLQSDKTVNHGQLAGYLTMHFNEVGE